MRDYVYAVLIALLVVAVAGCARPAGVVEAAALQSAEAPNVPTNKTVPTAIPLEVDAPTKTRWELRQFERGFWRDPGWEWTITGKPAIVRWYDKRTFVQFEDSEVVILGGYQGITPGKVAKIKASHIGHEALPPRTPALSACDELDVEQ